MNKKYILTEWPESQEVMGHPDCYLVSSCNDEATVDGACMVPEELFLELKTNNRSLCDITSMHSQYQFLENLLKESIRHYLSRLLIETDEENPLECKICLSNTEGFGLSTLNFPWIYQIWQHPVEGIIYFSFNPDGSEAVEFDNMVLEDLITICKELDEN